MRWTLIVMAGALAALAAGCQSDQTAADESYSSDWQSTAGTAYGVDDRVGPASGTDNFGGTLDSTRRAPYAPGPVRMPGPAMGSER